MKVWTEAKQHRLRSLESFRNPGIFDDTVPAVNAGSSMQVWGRTGPSRARGSQGWGLLVEETENSSSFTLPNEEIDIFFLRMFQ
jgi:hypothetical protein